MPPDAKMCDPRLPAARAGTSGEMARFMGKFQGASCSTTPLGSRRMALLAGCCVAWVATLSGFIQVRRLAMAKSTSCYAFLQSQHVMAKQTNQHRAMLN